MLVTDANRDRHRHDAAKDRRPERYDETLIRLAENNQLVTSPHAPRLERTEQRQRALPEFAESHPRLVFLAVDKQDVTVAILHLREKVNQCVVEFHSPNWLLVQAQ